MEVEAEMLGTKKNFEDKFKEEALDYNDGKITEEQYQTIQEYSESEFLIQL